MFTRIKEVMGSRQFQTSVGQVGVAVVSIAVSSIVSQLVAKNLNNGLEALMDKIHGTIEEIAAE